MGNLDIIFVNKKCNRRFEEFSLYTLGTMQGRKLATASDSSPSNANQVDLSARSMTVIALSPWASKNNPHTHLPSFFFKNVEYRLLKGENGNSFATVSRENLDTIVWFV